MIAVVRDTTTGEIFVGLNTGVPTNPTEVVRDAIQARESRLRGTVQARYNFEAGTHAEVVAFNSAVRAREQRTGRSVIDADRSTFELHTVWLSGTDRRGSAAVRCPHCSDIVRGLTVTTSLHQAEAHRARQKQLDAAGGGSGEVRVPQRGSVKATAGERGRQVTTASGEIDTGPSRARGGGSGRAAVGAGAAGLIEAGAVLWINGMLEEHYRAFRAEAARELTDQAIARANPAFLAAIDKHSGEIVAAHAQGRLVHLHFTTEVAYTDTTDRDPISGSGLSIGDIAYVAHVKDVQIVFEGEKPKRYKPDTNWAGNLFRDIVGVTLKYHSRTELLQGTDMAVRHRNEVVKEIDGILGSRAVPFEALLVATQYGGLPKDKLRLYANARAEQAATAPAPSASRRRQDVVYWMDMGYLVDAPIGEVIMQAKIKSVSLDGLLKHARQAKLEAGKQSDGGRGAAVAAYWDSVIRLIGVPLDGPASAERQRELWKQPASQMELSTQRTQVRTLQTRIVELEERLKVLHHRDARTADERAGGEPPHPPWAEIAEVKRTVASLREDLGVEKRILKDLEKR